MATQPTASLSNRTPQEIFQHHAEALGAEDADGAALDYAETAYIITRDGIMQGKQAIRDFFAGVFKALPQAKWDVEPTFVEDILFLLWKADSTVARVSDGVDTFVFQDGLIRVQTVHYTLEPKE